MIADFELEREKTITNAEYMMKYELSFIERYFNKDVMTLEEEYEVSLFEFIPCELIPL